MNITIKIKNPLLTHKRFHELLAYPLGESLECAVNRGSGRTLGQAFAAIGAALSRPYELIQVQDHAGCTRILNENLLANIITLISEQKLRHIKAKLVQVSVNNYNVHVLYSDEPDEPDDVAHKAAPPISRPSEF